MVSYFSLLSRKKKEREKTVFTYSRESLEAVMEPHDRIKSPCDRAVAAKGMAYAWPQGKKFLNLFSVDLHCLPHPHTLSLSSSKTGYRSYHCQLPNQHCWIVSPESRFDSQQPTFQAPMEAVGQWVEQEAWYWESWLSGPAPHSALLHWTPVLLL